MWITGINSTGNNSLELSRKGNNIIRKCIIFLFALGLANTAILFSQTKQDTRYYDPSKRFFFTIYGTYVSSSQLLNNPRSTDPFERDASVDLNSGYGYGAELSYEPPVLDLDLIFYISAEYFKSTTNDLVLRLDNGVNTASVKISETYSMVPIEMGVKWPLPVSSDNFKIYIGGGGGIYFGNRTRTLLNLKSANIDIKPGLSLNVLAGLEYYVARNLSALFEVKFREASFDAESAFNTNVITVNGAQFSLENPFYTRFIIDGVRLSAGIKYQF